MVHCETCGTTENLQTHHDSYEPEITRLLCVSCHQEQHVGHGVGSPIGSRHRLSKNIDAFSEKWDLGYTYSELMQEFNISYATVWKWANLLKKGRRLVKSTSGTKNIAITSYNWRRLNALKQPGYSFNKVMTNLLDEMEV